MLYLLAIVAPPIAILLCGKPLTAFFNIFLTLFFWVPGVVHAVLVVNETKADRRARKYGCPPR